MQGSVRGSRQAFHATNIRKDCRDCLLGEKAMKKIVVIGMAAILLLSSLTGCFGKNSNSSEFEGNSTNVTSSLPDEDKATDSNAELVTDESSIEAETEGSIMSGSEPSGQDGDI